MKINIPKNPNKAELYTGKEYTGIGVTNRQAIESFRHLIAEKGPLSDELGLSKREIYFALLRYRSYIISEKYRQNPQRISKHTYQTIPCIPLIKVDSVECPIEERSGCVWRKTKFPVPKPIGDYTSVVSLAGNIKYDYLPWERFRELSNSKFSSEIKAPYFTTKTVGKHCHVYLWNDRHKENVQITAIFENPLDVQNYYDCKTGEMDPCFAPLDEEFVIDADLLPRVYELALNQYMKPKRMANDTYNNDQDDVTQNQTPQK